MLTSLPNQRPDLLRQRKLYRNSTANRAVTAEETNQRNTGAGSPDLEALLTSIPIPAPRSRRASQEHLPIVSLPTMNPASVPWSQLSNPTVALCRTADTLHTHTHTIHLIRQCREHPSNTIDKHQDRSVGRSAYRERSSHLKPWFSVDPLD